MSFVDALVTSSLSSAELNIRHDDVKKAGATRHPPGLTYLLTEVVCHAAGGPEVVTASDSFEEAKLGVPAEQWAAFLPLVSQAAEAVWPYKPIIKASIEALIEALPTAKAETRSTIIELLTNSVPKSAHAPCAPPRPIYSCVLPPAHPHENNSWYAQVTRARGSCSTMQ